MDRNYEQAKKRYILTDLTIEQIAEEFNIPTSTLQKRAAKEKWKELRTKSSKKKTRKVIEKAIDRASTRAATDLNKSMEQELDLAMQLMGHIKRALEDDQQFNRFIMQGAQGSTKEIVSKKVDTFALKDMATALEKVEGIHRRTSKQLTRLEEERLALEREKIMLERERLEIAKIKAGDTGDLEERGIVYMPSVDLATYQKEQAAFIAGIQEQEEGGNND